MWWVNFQFSWGNKPQTLQSCIHRVCFYQLSYLIHLFWSVCVCVCPWLCEKARQTESRESISQTCCIILKQQKIGQPSNKWHVEGDHGATMCTCQRRHARKHLKYSQPHKHRQNYRLKILWFHGWFSQDWSWSDLENLPLAITRRDRYCMYVSVCLCLYSVVWKCWFLEFKSFTVWVIVSIFVGLVFDCIKRFFGCIPVMGKLLEWLKK